MELGSQKIQKKKKCSNHQAYNSQMFWNNGKLENMNYSPRNIESKVVFKP